MLSLKKIKLLVPSVIVAVLMIINGASASEIDLKIPSLDVGYDILGYAINGSQILFYGLIICVLGLIFGLVEFVKIKAMPAHKSMLDVSALIYSTCRTYMKQQAKLLVILELFIAVCIFYYFYVLQETPLAKVLTILAWSI